MMAKSFLFTDVYTLNKTHHMRKSKACLTQIFIPFDYMKQSIPQICSKHAVTKLYEDCKIVFIEVQMLFSQLEKMANSKI